MKRYKKNKGFADPLPCFRFFCADTKEDIFSQIDPFFRLSQFHLAILENIQQKKSHIAYQIYLDFLAKKEDFAVKEGPYLEEFQDIVVDIVESLQEIGYPASKDDLIGI